MRSGYRPATCPPTTASQRHTPLTRPPRFPAGSAHPLYWGVILCFSATKPKPLSGAHACCSNTSNLGISLFFWLGSYKQWRGIPNTFALWDSVICILYRCTDKNDTMYRNRVWKHLPSGPWSSRSLQRQRGALEPFIQKPDRPLCWHTLSPPRNKKKTIHQASALTRTHVNLCIYLQWWAGAAGLHGDAARPRRKEENEARGGAETAEGAGGWTSSGLHRGGRWKTGRRRSQGGDEGGAGGSVLASESRFQTTISHKSCFVQWIQQRQQWPHQLRQTSKTASLPYSITVHMHVIHKIVKWMLTFLLQNKQCNKCDNDHICIINIWLGIIKALMTNYE